jgi:hypothetical protein
MPFTFEREAIMMAVLLAAPVFPGLVLELLDPALFLRR